MGNSHKNHLVWNLICIEYRFHDAIHIDFISCYYSITISIRLIPLNSNVTEVTCPEIYKDNNAWENSTNSKPVFHF
jgi:hypothetical protein